MNRKQLIILLSSLGLILSTVFLIGYFFKGGINFNNKNVEIRIVKGGDIYEGYNTNGILSYENLNVLIVNRDNIDTIKQALRKGKIKYNGDEVDFINLNSRSGCDAVTYGSILHFMKYDNKVLFKSKNCIPDNQHIKKVRD